MIQKQPPRGILKKRCSENMQQIYRRTPMPKCDSIKLQSNFIEITLRLGCSPVNVLHIFRHLFQGTRLGGGFFMIVQSEKKRVAAQFEIHSNYFE